MAKTKAKAAPAEDLELEELDEDIEAEASPNGTQEVTFGVSHLAEYLSEKTGKTIKPRELRTLIRKMARDGSNRVDREITAGNRTRYDWPTGLKDPEVKAIVKAVTGGELEAGKREALQALKDRKAAQKAADEKAGVKTKKKKNKPAPAPVVEDDDEDEVDDLELEDDDDE
jgi:hypothetical protein